MVAKKEPLRMPRIDGIAAAREIRGNIPVSKLSACQSMRTDIARRDGKSWGLGVYQKSKREGAGI